MQIAGFEENDVAPCLHKSNAASGLDKTTFRWIASNQAPIWHLAKANTCPYPFCQNRCWHHIGWTRELGKIPFSHDRCQASSQGAFRHGPHLLHDVFSQTDASTQLLVLCCLQNHISDRQVAETTCTLYLAWAALFA